MAGTSGASAQSEGGLYVAGAGFSFQVAAERAMSQNPGGRRFFLLTLPPEVAALGASASPVQRRLRERVVAANGVLLVCQRDLDNGRIDAAHLASGVVPVRGWPAPGSNELPAGQRHFRTRTRPRCLRPTRPCASLRFTCS